MGFQRAVQNNPAPAAPGDFASANPRSSIVPPVEAGFVAAAGQSITIGYFAWGATTGLVYSSSAGAGAGASCGFVASQANRPSSLITTFLGESRLTLNDGLNVTLLKSGDYWCELQGGAIGDSVYAVAATGKPSLSNGGGNTDTGFKLASVAPVDAVSDAASTIALNTGILNIAVVASGVFEAGQKVTGTGVPAETYIVRQLTGAAGGVGTYLTNSVGRAAVAAFTATATQGKLAKITRVAG